jgi:membrane fusion protein, multidrug efflux system
MMCRARLALLLSLALTVSAGCREASGQGPAPLPPVHVRTQAIERTTREVTRRFTGYVKPWRAHGVGFLVPGRVTSLAVEAGDEVTPGQLLATLDPQDYGLVRDLAGIQVKALKPNFKRVDELVQDQVLPAAQRDELWGKYHAALTQQEQARRQVAHTRLEAPVSGVVLSRETEEGQVIGAGMPAVVLLELKRVKIEIGVVQQDLHLFPKGEALTLTFPGQAEPARGVVHHVGLVPDPKTRTYTVQVAVDNPLSALRPGMLAHARLSVRQADGVFLPLWIIKRDAQARPVVYLLDEASGRVVERVVTLGALFGAEIQVTAGLEPGERVIVEGQGFVSPDDEVRTR